jgi:hypothetical protein
MTVPSLGTDAATAVPKAMTAREATAVAWEVIQYGGRSFHCKPEMARIFLKHAREVIESGDEQLVPLLHSGGIELLLVSRATPYSLLDPSEG